LTIKEIIVLDRQQFDNITALKIINYGKLHFNHGKIQKLAIIHYKIGIKLYSSIGYKISVLCRVLHDFLLLRGLIGQEICNIVNKMP